MFSGLALAASGTSATACDQWFSDSLLYSHCTLLYIILHSCCCVGLHGLIYAYSCGRPDYHDKHDSSEYHGWRSCVIYIYDTTPTLAAHSIAHICVLGVCSTAQAHNILCTV